MKRVFTLAVVFMYIFTAYAVAQTPSEFMKQRGISVIDAGELAESLGGKRTKNDPSVVACVYNDSTFGNVIIWSEDDAIYCTADILAMLFEGGMLSDADGLRRVFTDFCNSFDFELYVFTGPAFTYYHPTSLATYKLGESMDEYGEKKMCWTKKGFLKEVNLKLVQ